ncbi:uncharacterized protein LOC117653572 isoform X3 [Thrips palmi]|uniref:Uncharacterized protein LOC117653572 isoform X3 n=1 Tax=Thrips palmi TaxID=161013 RepID=A0A6P9AAZ0_THRPL|nr:uncharacterized protein LOC117653572 isoform X3 [Thrips palmi]
MSEHYKTCTEFEARGNNYSCSSSESSGQDNISVFKHNSGAEHACNCGLMESHPNEGMDNVDDSENNDNNSFDMGTDTLNDHVVPDPIHFALLIMIS